MKVLATLILCVLISTTNFAQDANGFYKKAKKAFDKYLQSENTEKLDEAYREINRALQTLNESENKKSDRILMKAGEIFNEIALQDYKLYLVNNNHKPKFPNVAMRAFEAFKKISEQAEKKWDKNKAMDELLKTATFLSTEGIVDYNTEEYDKAYTAFLTILDIRDLLNNSDHVSILNKEEEYKEHIFRTALAAKKANKNQEAIDLLEQLAESQYPEPVVYISLYDLYLEQGNSARALTTLNNGVELNPNDKKLFVKQINHYLEKGEFEVLKEKLELATIEYPNEAKFHATLGKVYDQLRLSALENKNTSDADAYFVKAVEAFDQALNLNPDYKPALFNLGALYYNYAAMITQELKILETDRSTNGLKEASMKRAELLRMLDKSLPYFQKTEAIDPNDQSTLSALMEIFERKDQPELAQEFKSRFDRVVAGEIIEQSYFSLN